MYLEGKMVPPWISCLSCLSSIMNNTALSCSTACCRRIELWEYKYDWYVYKDWFYTGTQTGYKMERHKCGLAFYYNQNDETQTRIDNGETHRRTRTNGFYIKPNEQ